MSAPDSTTTLHVIRHGKASPGEDNYDQLHERGIAQARLLGAHLGRRRARFDAVYCGPLVRQRDTLRLMREAAGAPAGGWPDARILDGLREAPVEMLMRQCMVERLGMDAALDALVARVQTAGADRPALRVAMGAVFDHMIDLWRAGTLAREGLEPYVAFRERVLGALGTIVAEAARAHDVAVVTSNGVIGCVVEHVEAGEAGARAGRQRPELQFANTSITRLAVRDGAIEVVARNVVEHLDDEKLVTYL
jgi:broad specificity phosphatase PhoE